MVAGIEAGNTASVVLHRRAGFEEAGLLREFGCWLDLLACGKRCPARRTWTADPKLRYNG